MFLALEAFSVFQPQHSNLQVCHLLMFFKCEILVFLEFLLVELGELQLLLELGERGGVVGEGGLELGQLLVLFFLEKHEGAEPFELSLQVAGVLFFLELAELRVLHRR